MGKLLYITASPRGERSRSLQVAEIFVEEYTKVHPGDEVATIDVFSAELPVFDGDVIKAKYNIMHGEEHSQAEREAWTEVEEIISEFKSADKYLLATPMWNFNIPYRLKQYIDIIVQPGYAFSYDAETGYTGLVTGRPFMGVYARGGKYLGDAESEASDLQTRYIELIFGFMGFTDMRSIIVEPTLTEGKEGADEAVRKAIEEARQAARNF